jgi:hypothetical protein
MLNFIRQFFYSQARRREIFRFWDGQKVRGADPIAAWRALIADPDFDIERDTAMLENFNDNGAWLRCVNATRKALNVAEFDAGGLTENELFSCFQNFIVTVNALKKNFSHWPTSSGASARGPATALGQIWPPPDTTKPAASISINDEPNYGGPPLPPTASPPPLSRTPQLSVP